MRIIRTRRENDRKDFRWTSEQIENDLLGGIYEPENEPDVRVIVLPRPISTLPPCCIFTSNNSPAEPFQPAAFSGKFRKIGPMDETITLEFQS